MLEHGAKRGLPCGVIGDGDDSCGRVAIAMWNQHDRRWHIQCMSIVNHSMIKANLAGEDWWVVNG